MADKSVCKIDGCGKPSRKRGWCIAHYQRWYLHGNPKRGGPLRTSPGEPDRYFNETVMPYEGDECLFWPYARSDGYPTLSRDGENRYVHRLVCEEANGPPPTPRHQAAHSCGNGHLACVTKRHLSWKTHIDNEADKIGHGTVARGERQGGSKLSEADVLEILALRGTMPQREVARMFGVSKMNISLIQRRKIWAWLE